MAEPLKPVGFWSYTSSDDAHSGKHLSALRLALAGELQLVTGRQKVQIFQDQTAIPLGADWFKQIEQALNESSFLIPIVTPALLESEMCCREVMHFHRREQRLGRDDLIFPFHYIDISDIEENEVHDPDVLALLKSRQRFDFARLRHYASETQEVKTKLSDLAMSIRAALRRGAAPRPPAQPSPAIIRMPEPGAVTRDGPGPEMVLIPPGTFLMGVPEAESKREGTNDADARPQHKVTIPRPFWLGRYPVTRGEYALFAAETGRSDHHWTKTGFLQDDRHPVVNVSYLDAQAYTDWLSRRTGQAYRLPSEAEWEYAARAGTTTARYWGEAAGNPGEHAQFSENFRDVGGTCAVGSFAANPFGLYDMLGNVWEWTADPWHENYQGAPSDGSAWTAGGSAVGVLRGGSWERQARNARAACRDRNDPANRDSNAGFRCARVQS